jgi:hypothetical protein
MERTITESGALYFVQHKWEPPDTPRTASGKAPSPNLISKLRRGILGRLNKLHVAGRSDQNDEANAKADVAA